MPGHCWAWAPGLGSGLCPRGATLTMGPTQEDSGTLKARAQPVGCLGLRMEPAPLPQEGQQSLPSVLAFRFLATTHR